MNNSSRILVVLAALFAYQDSVAWLLRRWQTAEGSLHLVLALGIALVLLRDLDWRAVREAFRQPQRPARAAVALILLGSIGGTLIHLRFPAHAVLAAAGVVTAYGVAGLFVSPGTWRSQRGVALLAMGALPLSAHLDTLLGFPLRQGLAQAAASLLGAQVDASTVLSIEGAAAHIDIPCSGVQSLWSAGVVLAFAAVVWRQRIDLGWFGLYGLTVGILLVANLGRIVALVAAHHVLGLPLLAAILHVPLGLIGFVMGLAPSLWLLRRRAHLPPAAALKTWAPTVLWPTAAVLVLTAFLHTTPVPALPTQHLVLPADAIELPLSRPEQLHARQQGARLQKVRIAGGSAVMVLSGNWVAHHVPEQCHEAAGWTLSNERLADVGGRTVRWAEATREGKRTTVLWWFQRQGRWTPDHTARIAEGLLDDTPWILVSVLLDHPKNPDDPDVEALVDTLADAASRSLEIP